MRLARTVIGIFIIVFAVPLLLAGVLLDLARGHRDAGGEYSAALADVGTRGYAVVVPDLDGLLRRDIPFARGGHTTLRVTAGSGAFVGVAARADVDRYLDGVAQARVSRVRLARGPLPVDSAGVSGKALPAGTPDVQGFWLASGTGTTVIVPSALRGQAVSLVVMNPDASAGVRPELSVGLAPEWLTPTAAGSTILGAVLLLFGAALAAWPPRREVVHVLDPHVAAQLGLVAPKRLNRPRHRANLGQNRAATTVTLPRVADGRAPWGTLPPPPVRPTLLWPPLDSSRPTTAPILVEVPATYGRSLADPVPPIAAQRTAPADDLSADDLSDGDLSADDLSDGDLSAGADGGFEGGFEYRGSIFDDWAGPAEFVAEPVEDSTVDADGDADAEVFAEAGDVHAADAEAGDVAAEGDGGQDGVADFDDVLGIAVPPMAEERFEATQRVATGRRPVDGLSSESGAADVRDGSVPAGAEPARIS